jgi:type I restriction enzyme S subunit
MKSKILLDNLDLLSNEVSTIQHLRNLIIDLAVTGRFSQGMFRSELGSEVIRNSIDKSNSKTIKNSDESLSYCDIPNHWSWSNTEILCHTQTGATPDKSGSIDENSLTYITSADIQGFRAHSENKVSRSLEDKKLRIAPAGSILFVGIGDVGRCGVTEIESTFNQQIHSATPYVANAKFLCLFYSSTFFRNQIKLLSSATTLTILNKSKWSSIPVPVPSLIEQQWIVEKAEELLGICDELEARLNIRKLVETASRKSVVDAVSTAQSTEELEIAWKLIEDNWGVIAGTRESINSLRQLLVDLAIQGQLFGRRPIGSHGYPDAWEVNDFRSIGNIEGGNQPPKSVFISEPREGYVQLFQIRDLGPSPIPVFIPNDLARSTSVEGEILIGRYGASVGKIFRAKTGAYNVALVKFIYPKEKLDSEFVYWFLRSSRSQALFTGMSRSAQAGFNKRDLAPLLIPIPSKTEQQEIIERLNTLMKICDQLESSFLNASKLAGKFARSVCSVSSVSA